MGLMGLACLMHAHLKDKYEVEDQTRKYTGRTTGLYCGGRRHEGRAQLLWVEVRRAAVLTAREAQDAAAVATVSGGLRPEPGGVLIS